MDLKLADKTSLVSGSTKGIGFAIATGLAREGARVIVNGRSEKAVAEAKDQIDQTVPDARIESFAGDFSTTAAAEEDVARAFCSIERFKHGVRSMEAILKMCDVRPERTLGPSDLPAKAQLEMHVDAARFLDLLVGSKGTPESRLADTAISSPSVL